MMLPQQTDDRPGIGEAEIWRILAHSLDGWEEWIDTSGAVIFVTPSCQRYTGLAPETLQATPESLPGCIHPDDRQNFQAARLAFIERAAPTNQAAPKEQAAHEFRLAIDGGQPQWMAMQAVGGNDPAGSWRGVRLRYVDIGARKEAEEALQREHRAIQALIDTPTDVFTLLDRSGTILAGNEFMARGLRRPLDSLIGKNVFEIYAPERREARRAAFLQVLATGKPVLLDDRNATGQLFFDSTLYPVLGDDGQVIQVVILARDVTERHRLMQAVSRARDELEERVAERTAELLQANYSLQTENSLRMQAEMRWRKNAAHAEALNRIAARLNAHLDSEALLNVICEESLAALPGFSLALIMLYEEATDLLSPRAIAGASIQLDQFPRVHRTRHGDLLGNDDRTLIVADLRVHPLTSDVKQVKQFDLCTVIIQPLQSDDQLLGYLGLFSIAAPRQVDDEDLRLITGLSEHVCIAVKNAQLYQRSCETQERLRALSDRLIEVREDERRLLASELYDGFGQSLTALSLSLDRAARVMQTAKESLSRQVSDTSGEPAQDAIYHTAKTSESENIAGMQTIETLRAQVGNLLQKARDLSQDLRPQVLDDMGLFPALVDYCERFARQTGVRVHLRQSGALQRFNEYVETTVFRVAQEALTNVARHAGASEASVLLWCDQELLGLRIEDHGVGFSCEIEARSTLAGMQEMAALSGGSLEIESGLGQGTTLTLEIPLLPAD